MKISIVIPAFNEENRIKLTLEKMISYLTKNRYQYEIIVVDDGSTDKTAKVASNYKKVKVLINEQNKGKGFSIKKGILNAKYPTVLFSDSDLAVPIDELPKLQKYMPKFDIVISSRNLKGSNIITKQPVYRQMMGKIFSLLVRIISIKDFKDTQCGFKLFKTKVAKQIVSLQTINRFSFDVEMLVIAKNAGFRVKEVPTKWIDKEGSSVSPIKDSIRMFKDLLLIRYNDIRGKYNFKND